MSAWGGWDSCGDPGRGRVQICHKGAPGRDRPRRKARNINDSSRASRLDRGLCGRFGQSAGMGRAGRAAPVAGAPTTAVTTSTTAAAPRERRSGAGPRRPARSRMSRPSPGPVGTPPILRERAGFQSNAHLPSARSTRNRRAREERRTGVGAGRQGRSRSRGRRGRRRRRRRGPFRSPEWGPRRGMIAGARARGPTPGPRRPPPVAVGTDHRGPPLPEPNAGDRGRHCRRSPLPEVTADRRPPAGGRTFGYNV